MVRRRDHTPIQVPVSHRAGPLLDIQSPPPLIPVVAPWPSQSESTSKSPTVIVLRRDSAPPIRQPLWTSEMLRPLRRQPRPEPPVSQGIVPATPEPIRERSRLHHDMHDASRPSRRAQTPGPERSPSARSPRPFLPESLYDQRPPAAPARLEGEDPPPGSTTGSLYIQHRPEGVVPPPGVINGQPSQLGAPAQGPAYVLMPSGPAVVQLPLLFDTLMEKLREHRLTQLATVDQQRELMKYMNDLNDWLAKDVRDRQAGLQAITAQANQLRRGLGRSGVDAGPGISTPEPQSQPQMGRPTGVNGFIVPPVAPTPGGSVSPVVPCPAAFFPQGGPQPPTIPRMDQSPSAHSPVIPEVPAGWGRPTPGPSQNVGPTGSVLPAEMPYGEYHPTHPSRYVHLIEEPNEPVILPTPSPVLRSPLPVPGHGMMFVPPLPSHDSRSSTPAQESYPPRSRALPVGPGDVPNVIRVQPGPGVPTGLIVSHPPTPPVPLSESAYVPSRASSSMSTYDTTIPSERGVRDRRPSVSMEEVPESPRRYPSRASAVENDQNGPQRMPLRGAAPMLPADLDDEQRTRLAHEHPSDLDSTPSLPSSRTATYFDSSRRSKSPSHQRSQTTTDGSRSSPRHLLARLVSLEEEVRKINAATIVATEPPEHSDQESAKLREELRLYKLQLENAQKEIFRAQEIIDQVASQRNEAEAEAARFRTKARRLQEVRFVMPVREEGRTMGDEGLYMGRQMGYNEGRYNSNETVPELSEGTSDEESEDPRFQLRSGASTRQQSKRSRSARSVRTFETSLHPLPPPAPLRVVPARVRMPFYSYRTPSPPSYLNELETIHPTPISPSTPIISNRPFRVPIDDGWIPTADSRASYIQVPPPHELQHPVSPSPSSATTEAPESRATQQSPPTPISPRIRSYDYNHQMSVPPAISSRTSTHISQYGLANRRPGSWSRNEIYVGRARSGSQPPRENTSRNEHRDQDRRHSSRTGADRADDDASPPWTPPRLLTPFAVPHPHQPPGFHYQARKLVAPPPLGDVEDPQLRRRVPTESAAVRLHPLPDDPASQLTRTRSEIVTPTPIGDINDPQHRRLVPTESTVAHSRPLPDRPVSLPTHTGFLLEHHQYPRQPRRGSAGSSILNTPPFESEATMSPRPSATIADISSPEATNQPLPQENVHQHRPSYSQSQSQSPSRHHHHHLSSSYDAPQRSGTTFTPRPIGFIPSSPRHSTTSSSSCKPGPERDHRHAHSHPTPTSASNRSATPSSDHVRTHIQSALTSIGHGVVEEMHGAVPPQTSHRRHRGWDSDRDNDRDRDAPHDWDGGRRDAGRDSERERNRDRDKDGEDPDTDLDDALSRSPAPLQRPVSLFDSDEEQ